MRDKRNSLLYWWPKVEHLPIPKPKTVCIPVDRQEMYEVFDGKPVRKEILKNLCAAAQPLGYPLFMRTDQSSGKHGWKDTCYVPDESSLGRCLIGVCRFNGEADFLGLPYESIVLREFLNLDWAFKAFHGDMPINKERRYFVKGGSIICHHPYWPKGAIRNVQDTDWERKLESLNKETEQEIEFLSTLAKIVGESVEDSWSVDFAVGNGTWYLIDMALMADSYHWEGCVNAPAD